MKDKISYLYPRAHYAWEMKRNDRNKLVMQLCGCVALATAIAGIIIYMTGV